jgi:hypothetical protein
MKETRVVVAVLVGALALAAEVLGQGAKLERIQPPGLMKPTGYSHVVTVAREDFLIEIEAIATVP